MALKRIFSRFKRRLKFCSTSENAVIRYDCDEYIPISKSGKYYSKRNGALNETFDEMYDQNLNLEHKVSRSEYFTSHHHRQQDEPLIVGDTGGYDFRKVREDDKDGVQKSATPKAINALLNLRYMRSKIFKTGLFNSDLQHMEDTISSGPEEPSGDFDGIFEDEERSELSLPVDKAQNGNTTFGTPFVLIEQLPFPKEDENNTKKTSKKSYKSKNVSKGNVLPPLAEITKHRRGKSDLSTVSDISSLSGTRDNPLEFSLETGFKRESAYLISLTEDIVRSLERKAARDQAKSDSGIGREHNAVPGCLVLVTDPRKRIFEIVPIPYCPEKATVLDILSEVSKRATDHRLKQQIYTGLAYDGMHFTSTMVPVDAILDSIAKRQPLLAVPQNVSAGQIEIVGKNLLQSPQVKILLEEQLVALGVASNIHRTDGPLINPSPPSPLEKNNQEQKTEL